MPATLKLHNLQRSRSLSLGEVNNSLNGYEMDEHSFYAVVIEKQVTRILSTLI